MSASRQLLPQPSSMDSLIKEMLDGITANLADRLQAEMKAHITKEMKDLKSAVIERPLHIQEMAAFLDIHENTLYKWISAGIVPPSCVHRLNGTAYLFPSQVVEFIKKS